jgi:hypothetical protein
MAAVRILLASKAPLSMPGGVGGSCTVHAAAQSPGVPARIDRAGACAPPREQRPAPAHCTRTLHPHTAPARLTCRAPHNAHSTTAAPQGHLCKMHIAAGPQVRKPAGTVRPPAWRAHALAAPRHRGPSGGGCCSPGLNTCAATSAQRSAAAMAGWRHMATLGSHNRACGNPRLKGVTPRSGGRRGLLQRMGRHRPQPLRITHIWTSATAAGARHTSPRPGCSVPS